MFRFFCYKMLTMDNRVFVAVFVLLCSSNDCEACFSHNNSESLKIPTGSSFYKGCKCAEPRDAKIIWLDANSSPVSELRPGTKSNVYAEWQDQNTYSLYIPNISKAISGVYKCVTFNNGQYYTLDFDIQAYDPLYFVKTNENQYLVNGEDAAITCEARGGSNLIITWHKEQSLIESDDEKYTITENGLAIKNVTKQDSGVYKCTALDPETGEGIDTDINVGVWTVPIIEELVATPERTVISGEVLSIECVASGMPHPEYSWKKISEMTKNVTWNEITNRIIFDSIDPDDRGTYECTAVNSAGNTTKQITIEVLLAPIVTEFKNVSAVEESIIQVVCKAMGRPRPNLNITFEGEKSEEPSSWNLRYPSEIETELYLTFRNVSRSHAGRYICNASNDVDYVTQDMDVSVLYKPYFKEDSEIIWGWTGHSVNLSCEVDSNPPAVINWKYQGNDIPTNEQVAINNLLTENQITMPILVDKQTMFGIYECVASNQFGEAKKLITLHEAFPPPPITNVTVVNVTSTTITFDISGPESVMGPPVIGFTSEYDESENYNITDIHINRTWAKVRPFKVDKLKPNTTYRIRFAAVNNVGAGAWSEIYDFMTLEKSTPEQPIWESDSETAASNGVLKWKVPDDNGEPVDHFDIRYCPISNDTIDDIMCKEERIKPTTEFKLNQMNANTTYYFEILAHNSLGNSSAANIYVTIPAEEKIPPFLSAAAVIGIAVLVVVFCLVILDVVLFVWRRQGIIANCCYKNNKKRIEDTILSRDKKGLLKDNGESVASDTLKRPDNKHTGIITGKHSAV